jgi:hypothetical protein
MITVLKPGCATSSIASRVQIDLTPPSVTLSIQSPTGESIVESSLLLDQMW